MFRTTFNEKERIWSGIDRPTVNTMNDSIGEILFAALKRYPNRIAQINDDNGVHCSFEEIYTKAVRAAQHIQTIDYKEGDIFAIMSKNNHNLAPIVIALFSLGYPFQTLDPTFTEAETAHLFALTKPTVVFSDIESYAVAEKSLRTLNNDAAIYTFGERIGKSHLVEDLFVETGRESEFVVVKVDDIQKTALILCSSGTTGLPKAICITHELMLSEMPNLRTENPDEVILCFSTVYWLSGILTFLLGTLQSATRLITTESFSPELSLRMIEKYKVTSIFSVVHQIVLTLKCPAIDTTDLSSVKRWFAGGSTISIETTRTLKRYIPKATILVGYGMSELFGGIAGNFAGGENESVGSLVSGARVKIVDEDGNRLNVGQDGEVCIKKEYNFAGYYGDKESTDAFYDAEGFVKTGDIGHFDQDALLYIVDRKKDILKYRSFMISPSEIENFLQNSPEIKSACVVGIKDFTSGDLPAAFVVRQDDSTISSEEISEMVARAFADGKKLRGGVYFVDSLPVTPSGKLLRRTLQVQAMKLYEASAQQSNSTD